jgi:P2-related tail formation protein
VCPPDRGVCPFAPGPEHYRRDTRGTDQLLFHLSVCSDDRAGAQSTVAAFRDRVSKIASSRATLNGMQTSLNPNIASMSASSSYIGVGSDRISASSVSQVSLGMVRGSSSKGPRSE